MEGTSLTTIDLFCGAGGLTEGFKQAGFNCVFATDFDQQAMETFKFNHPRVETWCEDIRKLDPRRILEVTNLKPGEVDVVMGGPPCQGFSLAGQRLPDDPKNKLFLEFIRLWANGFILLGREFKARISMKVIMLLPKGIIFRQCTRAMLQ